MMMQQWLLFTVMILGAAGVHAAEITTSTLSNTAGVECPITGVRVEAVATDSSGQVMTISIPEHLLRGSPNIRVLTPDLQVMAFKEFSEVRDEVEYGRKTFTLKMGTTEPIDFKIGFDSRQQ